MKNNKILLPDYLLSYAYSLTANEGCYVVMDLCNNFITYYDENLYNSKAEVLSQLSDKGYDVIDSGYMYGGNLYITIKL